MKTHLKIILLIITLLLFSLCSCTKTVLFKNKPVDVHFKLSTDKNEVKQTVTLGYNDSIRTIICVGSLDYVVKLNEGFAGRFTFIVKSEFYTPITMSINSGNEFNYHICTVIDTTIHGITNQTIYIPAN